MKTNLGTVDRVVRISAGLGCFLFSVYDNTWWGLVGFLPLTTAYFGVCPAYLPFGFSTAGQPPAGPA